MKLYGTNKIWVPVENGDSVPANSRTIDGKFHQQYSYVIVCSIEELLNVFAAGRRYGEDQNYPGFTTYLQSKGINI